MKNSTLPTKQENNAVATRENTRTLTPPVDMSLEDCIAYINDDELVEITPKAIRLRKYNYKNP